jgi:hypothetical protein
MRGQAQAGCSGSGQGGDRAVSFGLPQDRPEAPCAVGGAGACPERSRRTLAIRGPPEELYPAEPIPEDEGDGWEPVSDERTA